MNKMNKGLCIFSILLFALLLAGSAWAAGDLKITKLVADPLAIVSGTANFDTLEVNVFNSGSNLVTSKITLEVLDAATGLSQSPALIITGLSKSIVSNETEGWNSTIPNDLISLDISSIPAGSYQLVVEAYEVKVSEPDVLHDTESVFFTVKKPPAVPELDFVLIPLLALSVLTVVFFSDRYNKKAK